MLSTFWLNFRGLCFFLVLVGLNLGAGQVGQQGGGGGVEPVEPRQFIYSDFNYWEEAEDGSFGN